MVGRTAFCRYLTLVALFAATASLGSPVHQSQAQDAPPALRTIKPNPGGYRVNPGIGGYSTTLSEIWGPPVMPPAPKDFGPHFDFPAGGSESLNGPPDHSPYPN